MNAHSKCSITQCRCLGMSVSPTFTSGVSVSSNVVTILSINISPIVISMRVVLLSDTLCGLSQTLNINRAEDSRSYLYVR